MDKFIKNKIMTRTEKNELKSKSKRYAYYVYGSIILFILFVILMIVFRNLHILRNVFGGLAILSLILSFLSLIKSTDVTYKLIGYKNQLKTKRHSNLLRIAIDELNKKEFDKAIDIHKCMTLNNFRIFLNGYLICNGMNFDDEKIKERCKRFLDNAYRVS